MTYCLAIIPADLAGSAEQAGARAAAMYRDAAGEPPSGVTDLLGELSRRCAGRYLVTRRDAHGAIVTTPRPDRHLYETLLWLAKDRDVAIYDPSGARVYNPRGRIELEVSVGESLTLPFLTCGLLRDLVRRPLWPDPRCPFVVVARDDQEFIQVYRRDDGVYQLEHRQGGPAAHFRHDTVRSDLVIELMWAWAAAESGWRTAVDWVVADLAG